MGETSTTSLNSLTNDMVQHETFDGLSEQEQLFYRSIMKSLDCLKREPETETIEGIMNYSKSL